MSAVTWALSRAGVWLSSSPSVLISPLWPASGVAIAALLRFGPKIAPGIWIGTMASDLMAGDPLPFLILGPIGNTLEALVAWDLLTNRWPINQRFEQARDVLRFLAAGVIIPPLISATFGITGLTIGGVLQAETFPRSLALYWVANASSILMITPALMIIFRSKIIDAKRIPIIHLTILSAAISVGFSCESILEIQHWPLAYLPLPIVVWIAFSRGVEAATIANLFVSLSSTLFTIFNTGPFATQNTLNSLTLLIIHNIITTATALLLAAVRAELINSEAKAKQALANEAQWHALRTQIQPHFIFNALNTLRQLIQCDPKSGREFTTRLAAFLRSSMEITEKEKVTLRSEIAAVENYIALERFRFEERLRHRLYIEPEAENIQLPPFLLQTLVENAIKHGISQNINGGEISITGRILEEICYIRVENPYLQNNKSATEETQGIGLKNARARLRLLCGEHATITVAPIGGEYMRAEITIPI
ncbi:MAG: MASE1 domain-containing protein [Opitutaceae bacterium]|nr:MASE1 domain-containing protein [Opitutaceae bacterium]